MYFNMFNKLIATLSDGSQVLLTDITTRAVASSEIKNNFYLYSEYVIQDGETPEIIADKVYGDSYLHWVILICNDIIDPMYDWPLPYNILHDHVVATYGVGNEYAVHHYEDEMGNWVMGGSLGATAITNMQYEDQLNEAKRTIKILQPTYLSSFVDEFETKIKSQVI